ncbi:MAG: methyltransferase domain-containing protein [Rhodomicrobium sp.]
MPDFSRRDTTPELMDTEAVDYESFRACLKELAQANALSLAYRPTLAFFRRLIREQRWPKGRPLTVIDAGSGYGDFARKLDRWALNRGLPIEIVCVDMNPWSKRAGEEATEKGRPLRWITANIFDYRTEGGADVVICSLFAHHLPDATLVHFLRWLEDNSRIGWVINDLERHPLPYYFLKLAFWVTRRHRFMQHDGPVSVASAFKQKDWIRYLAEAGIALGVPRVEAWAPYRLCVSRVRPAS